MQQIELAELNIKLNCAEIIFRNGYFHYRWFTFRLIFTEYKYGTDKLFKT